MGLMAGLPLRGASFLVQAQLRDGQWVTFAQRLPEAPFAWPCKLLLALAVLLLSVIALSLLAVRWLTRPLGVLAVAADELGRDIRRPPLAAIATPISAPDAGLGAFTKGVPVTHRIASIG